MDWHQTLTNYKALFLRVWQLIIRPRTAWEEVSAEPSGRDVAMTFVFPLICFCGLATLIGRVVRDGFADGNFMRAFTDTCVVCFVLMGTYYLGTWGINMLRTRYLKHDDDMPLTYRFMAYSMALSFALAMMVGLFPELQLFKLVLQFYVAYMIWHGADVLLKVDEDKRMAFSLSAAAIVIVVPIVLQFLFEKLTFIFG